VTGCDSVNGRDSVNGGIGDSVNGVVTRCDSANGVVVTGCDSLTDGSLSDPDWKEDQRPPSRCHQQAWRPHCHRRGCVSVTGCDSLNGVTRCDSANGVVVTGCDSLTDGSLSEPDLMQKTGSANKEQLGLPGIAP